MRRLVLSLAGLVIGYVGLALVGYALIEIFSGNRHDRSLEASMTAVFVFGPIGAIIGIVTGALLPKSKKRD
jgi:hypothetical protein